MARTNRGRLELSDRTDRPRGKGTDHALKATDRLRGKGIDLALKATNRPRGRGPDPVPKAVDSNRKPIAKNCFSGGLLHWKDRSRISAPWPGHLNNCWATGMGNPGHSSVLAQVIAPEPVKGIDLAQRGTGR